MVQRVTRLFLSTSGGRSFLRVDMTLWVCTLSHMNKLRLGWCLHLHLFVMSAKCSEEMLSWKGCKERGRRVRTLIRFGQNSKLLWTESNLRIKLLPLFLGFFFFPFFFFTQVWINLHNEFCYFSVLYCMRVLVCFPFLLRRYISTSLDSYAKTPTAGSDTNWIMFTEYSLNF